MPPSGKLSDAQIQVIIDWINAGALESKNKDVEFSESLTGSLLCAASHYYYLILDQLAVEHEIFHTQPVVTLITNQCDR